MALHNHVVPFSSLRSTGFNARPTVQNHYRCKNEESPKGTVEYG